MTLNEQIEISRRYMPKAGAEKPVQVNESHQIKFGIELANRKPGDAKLVPVQEEAIKQLNSPTIYG